MSRSYKKTPGWTESSGSKRGRGLDMKAYANRSFRRYKGEVQNGNWYRKYSCSYDIYDYKFLNYSKNEVLYEIEHSICPIEFYKYYMK